MTWLDAYHPDPDVKAGMAAAAGVNIRQLHNLCRDQLGQTPGEVIRMVRLRYARSALETTTHSVTQIAAQVGYTGTSRFVRHYRERYGESPSATRAQVRALHRGLRQPPPAGSAEPTPPEVMPADLTPGGPRPRPGPGSGLGSESVAGLDGVRCLRPGGRVLHLAARFDAATVVRHAAAARAGLQVTLASTHPIPGVPDRDTLTLWSLDDLESLPGPAGVFDAVVVADRIEVPAALPTAWLGALADGGHLLVPLRGLGIVSASTFSAGHAAGYIYDDPGQGLQYLPNDIEPQMLQRLGSCPSSPVHPAEAALPAVWLDRALSWLKFHSRHLRHHREQHRRNGPVTWYLLDEDSGAWARAHIPAARRDPVPTVVQAVDGVLWETLAAQAQEWVRCMDPGHALEARVAINADGTFGIKVWG